MGVGLDLVVLIMMVLQDVLQQNHQGTLRNKICHLPPFLEGTGHTDGHTEGHTERSLWRGREGAWTWASAFSRAQGWHV